MRDFDPQGSTPAWLERRPDDPEMRSNRTWMARAQVFERSLIRSWVIQLDG